MCLQNSETAMKYEVEVFDSRMGETDYEKSKDFRTYDEAVRYARSLRTKRGEYVFVYVPMHDGASNYMLREDWTGGKHNRSLDEEIY